MQQEINPKERAARVTRARANELQKIELSIRDAVENETPIEINTRILNKLNRKLRK